VSIRQLLFPKNSTIRAPIASTAVSCPFLHPPDIPSPCTNSQSSFLGFSSESQPWVPLRRLQRGLHPHLRVTPGTYPLSAHRCHKHYCPHSFPRELSSPCHSSEPHWFLAVLFIPMDGALLFTSWQIHAVLTSKQSSP
jgi:hypothetical protein